MGFKGANLHRHQKSATCIIRSVLLNTFGAFYASVTAASETPVLVIPPNISDLGPPYNRSPIRPWQILDYWGDPQPGM